RPWSPIPIRDCGEPLQLLPEALLRIEPHPYVAAGAPYGEQASPFRLRSGVIERLLEAQRWLQGQQPVLRLAIFDAWRPLVVQRYMVEFSIVSECEARGLDPTVMSAERDAVVADVGRFWAPPSDDPATPPPHSTGAAVDLTLVDADGVVVAMGSEIDALGAVSEPDHYLEVAELLPDGDQRRQALLWHGHRQLLGEAMAAAGFVRHPNEWWHFSWGDQLWAWRHGPARQACYGRWLPG
ncbi:MAG: M15 family metallopeptidase, partial [Prochlorococcaceae cyanobacterium]